MKTKSTILALSLAASIAVLTGAAFAQEHAHESPTPPKSRWSFAGPFGKFDQGQLQRGFKVYKEVCQACHGLSLVSFRNLAEAGGPGFTAAQAQQIASEYKVQDGPDEKGEMFERNGRLADRFPPPGTWKNEQQARALYNGTVPPDLSVIAKARGYERGFPRWVGDFFTQYQEQGPDYITALLQGYRDSPPAGVTLPAGNFYNEYFPGHAIAMPPPLSDKRVEYTDGAPMTVAVAGSSDSAWLTRFWTLTWLMSGSLPGLKTTLMPTLPDELLVDEKYSRLSMPLSCASIGAAT